jgi:ribosome-associated protein
MTTQHEAAHEKERGKRLVETKRGTKRASGSTMKKPGKSARPLMHSSHGSHAKGASRVAVDAGEGGHVSATPRKRSTRLSVSTASTTSKGASAASKSKETGSKVARPKIADGPVPRLRKGKAPPPSAGESLASDSARELAVAIAIAALDKKAVGLEVLDVAGRVDYADFLVLMTGRSDRQVQALAQGIEAALREKGKRPLSVEGLPHASWVLMDFGDVVVHVFQDDARSSYDLDGLWMDARRIPLPIPDELR